MGEPTVAAVVVARVGTGAALSSVMAAVQAQSVPPAMLVVVAGADLAPVAREAAQAADVLVSGARAGGTERFVTGMRRAHERGADWLWLVRDDGVPDRTALATLLAASTAVPDLPPPALLVSKPVTATGAVDEVQLARPDYKRIERTVAAYEHGLQPIRWTHFTSSLVSRAAIDAHGFPDPGFATTEGEVEFTARILREEVGLLVPTSVVRAAPGAEAPLEASAGDTLRMLRSGSWALGESIGLGITRGIRALRLGVGR